MPWGATTLGRPNRITSIDSPYQASVGEIIEADTTTADVTVLSPPIGIGGKRFTVKKIGTNANAVIITTVDFLESKFTGELTNTSALSATGETISYYCELLDTAWRIYATAHASNYIEAFTATPIALVGADTTVEWNFAPLYTGQTQQLTSYDAPTDTFTYLFGGNFQIQMKVLWTFTSVSNDDAQGKAENLFSGAGLNLTDPIYSGFAHSRGGDYPISTPESGLVSIAKNDTMRTRLDIGLAQTGTTALTTAKLFMGFM